MITQTKQEQADPLAKQLTACQAAMALAGSGQKDRALRLLIDLARTGEVPVRIKVAECFMELGGERAIMELSDLTGDSNSQVRMAAVGALGALRIHRVLDRIMEVFKYDPEMDVRIMAARSLGKLGNKAGLGLVIDLLNRDNNRYRRLAVMALSDIIGQRFAPTSDGIKSAKRYLKVNLKHIMTGGMR